MRECVECANVGIKGNMNIRDKAILFGVLFGWMLIVAHVEAGELGFGRFYTDNMVLQRDKPVVIRGTAYENATVTLTFDGRVKTATADKEGQWSVALDALPVTQEPKTLSVTSEEKTGNVDAGFNESALKELKNGENTLAITTRHNWRWGMLSMHVYNDGFGFMLDARVATK